jgi:hypothetical protein
MQLESQGMIKVVPGKYRIREMARENGERVDRASAVLV